MQRTLMLSFDAANDILDQTASALPPVILEQLNGGIVLVPQAKQHPQSVAGDLYIFGEYHYDPHGLGRYIIIYYGSFAMCYAHAPDAFWSQRLEGVLHHELTHHLESLAGDRSLEYEDAAGIAAYLDRHKGGTQ